MYNFNYALFLMDLLILSAPFAVAEWGFFTTAQFFAGFAIMWIFMNVNKGKVTLRRYSITRLHEEQQEKRNKEV